MEHRQALTFISRIYQRQTVLFDSPETADEIMNDIEIFQVIPQIYYLMKNNGLLEAVPAEIRSRLKSGADAVLYQNMLIRSEMYKLLNAFEHAGIEVIVLKGIRLSERYFGHFAARGTSDIDLLIRPGDLDKAAALLERHEFIRYKEDDEDHFHILFNKFYASEDFPLLGVELHWDIMNKRISDMQLGGLWQEAEPIPPFRLVKELSVMDTFYHLCLHGYSHSMLSLKYVLDIMHVLIVCSEDIDYARLFEQARRDGNYAKVLIALTIVYDLFPELQEVKPLNAQKRWALWNVGLIHQVENGHRNWRYYGFQFISAFFAFDSARQRWEHLRYMLLPSREHALHMLKHDYRFDVQDPDEPVAKLYVRIYKRRLQTCIRLLHTRQRRSTERR